MPKSGLALLFALVVPAAAVASIACSSSSSATPPSGDDDDDTAAAADDDDSAGDDRGDDDATKDKARACATSFGEGITPPFGRLDGKVVAVVPPAHPTCAMPNRDHVVLQVSRDGVVHRMVINVESDFGDDLRVFYAEVSKPLPAPAWSEGWHTGLSLDYGTDLAIRPGAPTFALADLAQATKKITDAIDVGDEVSVYASTSSAGTGAHKIHRVGGGEDGAIFVHPKSPKPKVILFHFQTQTW